MQPPRNPPYPELTSQAMSLLGAGEGVLLLAAGAAARMRIAIDVALEGQAATLLITQWGARWLNAYGERAGADGRFGLLSPGNETTDVSGRLIAYEAALYRLLTVSPDQLWLAQLADSLLARPPSLVILDASSLAADITGIHLGALEIRERLRLLVGTCPCLVVSDPIGQARRDAIAAQFGLCVVQAGRVLPGGAAIRVVGVDDRDRMEKLRKLLRMGGKRAAVIAPSRGVASKLAAALQRQAFDCGVFHRGLSEAERRAVLSAYGDRRLRVLVATEAVAVEDVFACPDVLIFSHPPSSPDALERFASFAEGLKRELHVVVLTAAEDVAGLTQRARGRGPLISHVRETYRHVRQLAHNGYALVHTPDGSGRMATIGAKRAGTFVPSLQILQFGGYLRRLDDLPRAASLSLPNRRADEEAGPHIIALQRIRSVLAARPERFSSFSPYGLPRGLR